MLFLIIVYFGSDRESINAVTTIPNCEFQLHRHKIVMKVLSYICTDTRLTDFDIGTTITSPTETAPDNTRQGKNYQSCYHYDLQQSYLYQGEYKIFRCYSISRYVIVQLEKEAVLTLCEVEVFGGR